MNFSFRRTDRDDVKHPSSKKANINGPIIRNKIYSLKSLLTKSITMFFLVLLITIPVSSLSTFATNNVNTSNNNGSNNAILNSTTMSSDALLNGVGNVTNEGAVRNVILLIGDGMGDSEITIARYYEMGAGGKLVMDTLPFKGAVTTYSVEESNSSLPNYVPDSASTGTAWSTGEKTSNGRISTTPSTDQDLSTILELAQENGFHTGIVTTAELTDATPAVLASHVNDRDCQGPSDSETMELCPQDRKATGGPGSIAEQMVDHHVDVLLGGGKQRFDQTIDAGNFANQTVIDSAKSQGYSLITNASELANLQSLENNGTNSTKVLGLFAPGNMNMSWTGEAAAPYPGSGPQTCQENQRPPNEPSLSNMTSKAIDLLDKASSGQENGFFLQVEGASIDKRDHDAEPCQQIGETIAFDNAVKDALDFASSNPNTLVIVTADHAHTSQIIPLPEEQNHPGGFSTLVTKDGANMTINYATSPFYQGSTDQDHTGSQVSIMTQGPHAENFTGLIDQAEIFGILKGALLDNNTK
jgi:alkaline phosphatase